MTGERLEEKRVVDRYEDIQRRAEAEPARRAIRHAIGRRLRSELDQMLVEPVPAEWLALLQMADRPVTRR